MKREFILKWNWSRYHWFIGIDAVTINKNNGLLFIGVFPMSRLTIEWFIADGLEEIDFEM